MSGFIKYFDNEGKNMSFMIEGDSILVRYNDVWNKIKKIKGIKFHSNPVYDKKYIKAKVKEFNNVVNTNSWGDKVPKEGVYYTCIACKCIDSVMKIERKNYPQVFLEECKYKIKMKKMSKFIHAELGLNSDSNFE